MRHVLTLTLAILISSWAFAHSGGHHHHDHEGRDWHFPSGEVAATGHFLLVKEGIVFVEQHDGEVAKLKLGELEQEDQQFVQAKIEKIQKLNGIAGTAIEPQPLPQKKLNTGMFAGVSLLVLGVGYLLFRRSRSVSQQATTVVGCLVVISLAFASCKKDDDVDTGTPNANDVTTMTAAFGQYSNVSSSSDSDWFYVESDGLAQHTMMVNITEWIAQVPIIQPYTGQYRWQIPIQPQYADSPLSIEDEMQNGAIALAVNGIPIFNPINASGLISKEIGELDDFGGHAGRGDDYHYHAAPMHLESSNPALPIAYALDGFPVYGSLEPDGSAMEDLDAYHGHSDGDGGYHYHGTDDYPYVLGSMRGEVSLNPNTTSPQSQIIPQPVIPALRANPHGISTQNLIITAHTPNGNGNGYTLNYEISGQPGSVEYYWDANDLFTFIFNDVNGTTTTETFQR